MHNYFRVLGMLVAVAVLVAGCTETTLVDDGASSASVTKDSPGYIGFDFKFNIIGVQHDKTAPMDGNNGKRLFVQLYGGQQVCDPDAEVGEDLYCDAGDLVGGGSVPGGWFNDVTYSKKNKILLTPCDPADADCEFAILDANATDGDGGEIQVPDDVSFAYELYFRAVGTPGGSGRITPCADENILDTGDAGYETWCSSTSAVLTRETGKPKVENVTNELLFLDITVDASADSMLAACLGYPGQEGEINIDDIPLFDGCFENYFWNFDNNGLKVIQAWFKKIENPV